MTSRRHLILSTIDKTKNIHPCIEVNPCIQCEGIYILPRCLTKLNPKCLRLFIKLLIISKGCYYVSPRDYTPML